MPFQATTPEGRTAAQTATDAAGAAGGNPMLTLTIAGADTLIDSSVNAVTVASMRAALKVVAHLLIMLRDRQTLIIADQISIKKRLERGGL